MRTMAIELPVQPGQHPGEEPRDEQKRHDTPAAKDERARTEAEGALGWLGRLEQKFDDLSADIGELKLGQVSLQADVASLKEAKKTRSEHKIAKWGAAGGIAGAIALVVAAWIGRGGTQSASAASPPAPPTSEQSTSATFQAGKLEGYRTALQEFAAAAQANPPALSASLRIVAAAPKTR